jgi:hypothetical protein
MRISTVMNLARRFTGRTPEARKHALGVLYRKLREESGGWVGHSAEQAWKGANVLLRFVEAEERGLVRVIMRPDECYCYKNDDEWWDDAPRLSKEGKERAKREHYRMLDREGVWGIVGQYREDGVERPDEDVYRDEEPRHDSYQGWVESSSVWGVIGEDEGGYLVGILSDTLDALDAVWTDAAEAFAERATYAAGSAS